MHLKFFLVFLMVTRLTNVYSQKIEGFVKSETDIGISGAYISILNSNRYTISDSNGFFRLEIPNGSYQIAVNLTGFSSVVKNILVSENQTKQINFILKKNVQTLNEVIVTAEKREDKLIMTPMSVSVLPAEKIQDTRTWNLSNLVGLIPNYQYADVGVGYEQMISIRGVSVFSNNPTVATYVDGVNSLDITANGLQLMDVERIEVLRGPQGTLYGRNAMGGVINIITKAPCNTTSGFAETSVGNQGLQRYSFAVRTPLIKDKLFFGISGQFQIQHGYYGNDTTPQFTFLGKTFKGPADLNVRFGDAQSIYENMYLKWLASKKMNVVFNFKTQDDKSIGPSSYFQAAPNDSFALANPYKFTVNRFGSDERKIINSSIAVNCFYKKFILTSISAYQHILQSYNNIDADYWTFDVAYSGSFYNNVGDAFPQTVLSQELRFSSPAVSSKFKWTTGGYAFKQLYDYRTATVYVAPLATLFGYSGTDVSENNQDNSGVAAFGQATYSITKRLELTGGLRYDFENRQSTISSFNIDNNNNRTYSQKDSTRNKSFEAFSPKSIASYHLSENQNIYISYGRGFRAGGINSTTKFKGFETFNPEYSDNYELGYKLSSSNKKLLLTSTLYYMNWKNLQLDYRPDGITYITANIGNVHSKGAEVEVNALPFVFLKLDLALGVNDAKYYNTEYLGTNISGNQTIMAPKSTLMLGMQGYVPVSKKITGVIRLEWRRIGDQHFDLVNKINQPAYNLFNGRVGVTSKHLDVFLWCQNIFNETYLMYAMPAVFRYAILNRPRAYGITVTSKF